MKRSTWVKFGVAFLAVTFFTVGGMLFVRWADAHVASLKCSAIPGMFDATDASTQLPATFHFDDGQVFGIGPSGGSIPVAGKHTYWVTWSDGFRQPVEGTSPVPTGCGVLPSTLVTTVPHCPPGLTGPKCVVATTLPPSVQTNPATSVAQPTTTSTTVDVAPDVPVSSTPVVPSTVVRQSAPSTVALRSSLPATGGDTWRGIVAGLLCIAAGGLVIAAARVPKRSS